MIDVHCHWIPDNCFELPGGIPLRVVDGELYYGDAALQLDAADLTDRGALLDAAERMGVTTSVVSPPPIAFALGTDGSDVEYCREYNAALEAFAQDAHDSVVALGHLPLGRPDDALAMLEDVAARDDLVGIAVPPAVGDLRWDQEPLRSILRTAARHDLCVLVHPRQLPGPGLDHHYLQNLLGNPTETAGAVASLILGGVLEELPELRICFLHAGGVVPSVLGRWDHGWRARSDVRRDSSTPPSTGFRQVYVDTLAHGREQLRLAAAVAGHRRMVVGTDYPFDMADGDPLATVQDAGLDLDDLNAAALGFLGARVAARINHREGMKNHG